MGPAGSGKSTVARLFANEAANRGEKVIFFAFDEAVHTLLWRAAEMGQFHKHMESGNLSVRQIDPAEIAPGELAMEIVECVKSTVYA
jgi:circadian clock protein KaiC